MGTTTLLTLFTLLGLSLAASASTKTLSLHAWPLSAPSPTPYITIPYSASSPNNTLLLPLPSFKPSDSSTLVRLGFYTPSSSTSESDWTGIAVSATNFDPSRTQKLTLWLDDAVDVFALSFQGLAAPPAKELSRAEKKKIREAEKKKKNAKGKKGAAEKEEGEKKGEEEELVVELVRPVKAPGPVLDRPVVLNAEGKVDDKEPEKTFLQK